MANQTVAPPMLEPGHYERWRKEMAFWELATNVPDKKRAVTVFLTLTGKAREAVLEMDPTELNVDGGLSKVYDKLDGLFKVDKDQAMMNVYERFEKFIRPVEMSLDDFRVEFDRLVQQLKAHSIVLPDAVLAYRALKSANISPENEKIVRATVSCAKLQPMMMQLAKVAGIEHSTNSDKTAQDVKVKLEPNVNYADASEGASSDVADTEEVMYNSFKYRGRNQRFQNNSRRGRSFLQRGGAGRNKFRGRGSKKMNPPGPDGEPSTCSICNSIMHWVRDCPHNDNSESISDKAPVYDANIVLLNIEEHRETESLLGQTIGAAVLDSGCARTVCGSDWYSCFLDTLQDNARKDIKTESSYSVFRFGNGAELKSKFAVGIPCVLAGKHVEIKTDVIDSPVPLLLSKNSMKKARCKLDFSKDTVSFFGKEVKLHCTDSGHYFVPLSKPADTLMYSEVLYLKNIVSKSLPQKLKVAEKLHRQFSHPTSEKLISLIEDSGVEDQELMNVIRELTSKCEICLRYKKSKARPVVGFPLAKYFNEVVAVDIKEINGYKVLHMIDHATRYSAAAILRSKEAEEVVSAVFRFWIAYFGAPKTWLSDNGREFNNSVLREVAQSLNSSAQNTAAYSPWSNGLNERHNGILGEMVLKTLEDAKCSMSDAVCWAVSAKNALNNHNGFSSNQLVFGFNPNTPSVLVNRPPALEGASTSEMVATKLNALHAARRAFIQCESLEKLQKALRHQVRGNPSFQYQSGDRVYFKRPVSNRWMGPGTVIGSENKTVLVKHGESYIKVHPCSMQLVHSESNILNDWQEEETMTETKDKTVGHPSSSKDTDSLEQLDHVGVEEYEHDLDNEEVRCSPPVESTESSEDSPRIEIESHEDFTTNSEMSQTVARLRRSKIDSKWHIPQPGTQIKCKFAGENESEEVWSNVNVISRGGKATGSNKFVMNVSIEGGQPRWLDFKKSVVEWKLVEDSDTDKEGYEDANDIYYSSEHSPNEWEAAARNELSSWKSHGVYEQVVDEGQDRVSTRWIWTSKDGPDGKVAKARLVAKGFQDPEAGNTRSDSPTCAKESLRLMLMTVAAKNWSINSMDIKTAFLQGQEFQRDVYLLPPPEAKVPTGHLWKLNKCVYGLTDASRVWYLTVRDELIKNGMCVSSHDEAVFTLHCEGSLQGVVSTHVDDFCWAGTKYFESNVIQAIRQVFEVKSEERHAFRYLGLDIVQEDKVIYIKQDKFVQSINLMKIQRRVSPEDLMTEEEVSLCRSILGKLNWLSTQTRPDLSFDVSELTSALKEKKTELITRINKVIRKAKREPSQIMIPSIPMMEKCELITYSDASFANVAGVGSQGGHITYVTSGGQTVPIAWHSQKVKRVVKSTQAAETLAMVDAAEAAIYYKNFIMEMLGVKNPRLFPIICKTDSAALHSAVHSNTQILDKRLRIETAILREMLGKKEIASISWVPTTEQLADALTKAGVPSWKILQNSPN